MGLPIGYLKGHRYNLLNCDVYLSLKVLLNLANSNAMVQCINSLPCKPGVAGSIPGFSSLSNKTLSCCQFSI